MSTKVEKCCILGCDNRATCTDDLDNPFCFSCAVQNKYEEPDNWEYSLPDGVDE